MPKPTPRQSLERKIAAAVEQHATDGPSWDPERLAGEVLNLADSASEAEREYLLAIGRTTLMALLEQSPDGPVL